MRQIPDLMMCLQELTDGTVRQIRKTSEDPPRASVIDTIVVITGHSPTNSLHTWQRMSQSFPEVSQSVTNFKFSGQGQRPTPVADARTMVEIVMVLPGRTAAMHRRKAADIIVRYLGGDPSLVEEIAANRLQQAEMAENESARFFGQTVESEALKRKREELTMVELEGRMKRARVQAATDVARLTLGALLDLGLPVSDRDRMLAKDMITTAAFTQGQLLADNDRDICLQQFCAERGKAGGHISLGKKAKKLFLDDHPSYTFTKKDVYANGQIIQANRWVESMRPYLERALQLL